MIDEAFMNDMPQRKRIRLEEYDYSTVGAYFITICIASRNPIFWRRGDLWSPAGESFLNGASGDTHRSPLRDILSNAGIIVDNEMQKLNTVYPNVRVEKYCIMPDHIHMILRIADDPCGRPQVAPTISRVIKQFKGSISKQIGQSIWQKSFYEHGIRNQQDYDEIWEYIENNPRKYLLKREG